MMGGYVGKLLFVDLTEGSIREQALDERLAERFIGGYSLGARILYDMIAPGVDPLGPGNVLGFVTGPLTGSGAFFSGRYSVVCKSPVSGTWNDANAGGFFGPELKKAGYDAVFVSGASEKPVYLWIGDGHVEIRDARHLWGLDSRETQAALERETGEPKLRAAVIGPAGEKQSLLACVINDGHRAAARGGGGAVMGSKKLKAVAVRGTGKVPVADPEKLKEINKAITAAIKSDGPTKWLLDAFQAGGTGFGTGNSALMQDSPVRNWAGVGFRDYGEERAKLYNTTVIDVKYKTGRYACSSCPLGCGAHYEVNDGPWPIGKGDRPEYETWAAFGSICLCDSPEAGIKCNDICNRYGMDTISTGSTVAWAMECYEHGLLTKEDTGGIELTWGNAEAMVAMTQLMADQTGLGAILAHGSAAAARQLGRGAEYLVTVRGVELPMHDPRLSPGLARTYQFDPTPARHTKGGIGIPQIGESGTAKYNPEGTGLPDVQSSTFWECINITGLCQFIMYTGINDAPMSLMAAVTGWNWGGMQMYLSSLRSLYIRQAFNVREGLKPADFAIGGRGVGKPPLPDGPTANITVAHERLGQNFFGAIGWDWETGKPSNDGMLILGGLDDVVQDLYG